MPPSTLTPLVPSVQPLALPSGLHNGTASFSYSIQDTLGNTVATVAAQALAALQEGHSTVGDLVYAAVQHAQLQPQQALAGVLQNGLLYSSDWG